MKLEAPIKKYLERIQGYQGGIYPDDDATKTDAAKEAKKLKLVELGKRGKIVMTNLGRVSLHRAQAK